MKHNHENRITILETQQSEVLEQVKNHLPTQIRDLKTKVCDIRKAFDNYKLEQAKSQTKTAVSIAFLFLGIIINIIISLAH